jgi:hypothetical protein
VNELNATLTAQEWDIVGNALGQRPFAEVATIIQKLQAQIQAQQVKTQQEVKLREVNSGD